MSGGPWDDRQIACAKCATVYPVRYLRCRQCGHLTSASQEALRKRKPEGLVGVNWPMTLVAALSLWALIIAAVIALSG